MAFNRWLGSAAAISQISLITVDEAELTADSSQIITVKIGPASMAVPLGEASTAAAVYALLRTALSASTAPKQFKDATFTVRGTAALVATSKPGVPFDILVEEEVGTGNTFLSLTTEQLATGPNFYNNTANWSLGTLPVVTNDVIVDGALPGILYGLSPSLVLFNSLTITSEFNTSDSAIGLPEINQTHGYPEYRPRYLSVSTSKLIIGTGSGKGSPRININLGNVTCETVVHKTGAGTVAAPSVNILNNNASSKFTILQGIAQVGDRSSGAVGLFSEVYVAEGATLTIGANTVSTTVTNVGTLHAYGNIGTLKQLKGLATINDCGITTALIIEGGHNLSTLVYKSDNTIPDLSLGGHFDASQDPRSVTLTSLTVKKGSMITDTFGSIVYDEILVDQNIINMTFL